MISPRRTLGLALLAAAVLTLSSPAMAKRGRGRGGDDGRVDERVRLTLAQDAPFSAREAKLRMRRRKGLSRQEMKIELDGAPSGRSLQFLLENGAGTLSGISGLREKRAGVYVWRVRTRKGQSLPFGASDIAELSGRGLEIRTGSGDLVYTGTVPSIAAGAAAGGKRAKLRTELAVDGAVADTVAGDSGHRLAARVRVEHKSDREELRIQVEHAAEGLLLSAHMDDGAGVLVEIGVVGPDDDGDVGEYRLRFRTDRDALPFGAASVSELAGRSVEVRTDAGDVLAAGTIPVVASGQVAAAAADDGASDDDDRDADDDGDEDGDGDDDDGDADEDGDGDDDDGAADEDGDGDDDDGDADEDGDGDDDGADTDED